jgi:hypothetical protein
LDCPSRIFIGLKLLSLLKREKLSKNFLQRGRGLSFTVKEEGGVTPLSSLVFSLLALSGYGGFVLYWLIQGSFVLPGFVSSGADLLLVLWDYGAFLWFVSLFYGRKVHQEMSFG